MCSLITVDCLIVLTITFQKLHQLRIIKQGLLPRKIPYTENDNIFGSVFFNVGYVGSKLRSEIPENVVTLSTLSFDKQHKNFLFSCQYAR